MINAAVAAPSDLITLIIIVNIVRSAVFFNEKRCRGGQPFAGWWSKFCIAVSYRFKWIQLTHLTARFSPAAGM
jgi:hypothetical protein